MKLIEYFRLGECAKCCYSFKKENGKLKCNWHENKKTASNCITIKKCGDFPEGIVDISELRLTG